MDYRKSNDELISPTPPSLFDGNRLIKTQTVLGGVAIFDATPRRAIVSGRADRRHLPSVRLSA